MNSMNGERMEDLQVVDRTQIEKLREWGGDALPPKMIELFLSHAGERMEQIRSGIASRTAKEAEAGAHTLKSNAGNVGAKRVQALAQEAETLAEAEEFEKLEALFPSLEEEFGKACDALGTLLEGMRE
jgi:HPt (histidine-containing phosphotransfer) domain-containing protein